MFACGFRVPAVVQSSQVSLTWAASALGLGLRLEGHQGQGHGEVTCSSMAVILRAVRANTAAPGLSTGSKDRRLGALGNQASCYAADGSLIEVDQDLDISEPSLVTLTSRSKRSHVAACIRNPKASLESCIACGMYPTCLPLGGLGPDSAFRIATRCRSVSSEASPQTTT